MPRDVHGDQVTTTECKTRLWGLTTTETKQLQGLSKDHRDQVTRLRQLSDFYDGQVTTSKTTWPYDENFRFLHVNHKFLLRTVHLGCRFCLSPMSSFILFYVFLFFFVLLFFFSYLFAFCRAFYFHKLIWYCEFSSIALSPIFSFIWNWIKAAKVMVAEPQNTNKVQQQQWKTKRRRRNCKRIYCKQTLFEWTHLKFWISKYHSKISPKWIKASVPHLNLSMKRWEVAEDEWESFRVHTVTWNTWNTWIERSSPVRWWPKMGMQCGGNNENKKLNKYIR